jgi:hypothetical protein
MATEPAKTKTKSSGAKSEEEILAGNVSVALQY